MDLQGAVEYWRSRLDQGLPIYRVRVRRLLNLAGAERRGFAIANRIRATLTENGLKTEPDFEAVWIGSLVTIGLIERQKNALDEAIAQYPEEHQKAIDKLDSSDGTLDPGAEDTFTAAAESAQVAEVLNAPENNEGLVETLVEPPMDPVARISNIPAANRGVVSVLLDDPISTATTLMIFEGYSQLAIMQGKREVKGIISWESIAKRSLIEPPPKTVGDCRVDARVIEAHGSLFDALPTIEEFGYVLVRSQGTIAGIVTATDLTGEFGRISYAFMCVRTIEMLVRKKLHPHLNMEDLFHLEENSRARTEANVSLLTFGENVRMLERPEIWKRVNMKVDKRQFTARLFEIRDIRNEVMHFNPDPLSDMQRSRLRQMEDFLRQIFI